MWKRGCAFVLSLSLGAVSGLPAFAEQGTTPTKTGGVTFAADTTVFDRNVRVAGGLAVDGTVTCKVLTILGGMDVAEPVPVAADNLAGIGPGYVLSIDPEHPGSFLLASEPYDPKVAGVVSGANGIAPGLQLHTETEASPHLLAIAGRIYVRATAENGRIVPGSRLTTSHIPGVAMKATDPLRVSGSIIGKAMTALNAGEGWVLMLVQPQ